MEANGNSRRRTGFSPTWIIAAVAIMSVIFATGVSYSVVEGDHQAVKDLQTEMKQTRDDVQELKGQLNAIREESSRNHFLVQELAGKRQAAAKKKAEQ
jgi:TolA-binding protein